LPLPLAGEVDALGSAIARQSAAGGGILSICADTRGNTPTPTLPRRRERVLTVIAAPLNQCFNPNHVDETLITKATPMLDTPKNAEKSYAEDKILQSIADGVGVITFNNPQKRNAMSLDMWEGVGAALVELREDPGVRVVILTGSGDKAFVSGADISQFEKNRHNAEAAEEYSRKSAAQRALLADYPKPIIACIRGFCLGGGMQVAMSADIRIASDNSQFGIPAAKLGIAYGYDGLNHLVSLVGPSWARLIMYTGMRIDAAEAVRIGLVDRVVPDAELWDATMEIARTISGNAPLAIKAAKITIAQVLKDPGERDMDSIKTISTACMDSEDFREGRTAFMEKRKPQFKGR
jgi:enoyl-CoA hydratase/carnithine racemase